MSSPANDTRGLFDTAFTQTDKGIPVASQTSAIENNKEGRCAIAEHVLLRFPLTTPLICKTLFSAVGVTAFGSPSSSTTFHSLVVLNAKKEAAAVIEGYCDIFATPIDQRLIARSECRALSAKQNENKTADTIMCSPGLAAGAAKTAV
jgi:hypothetical protein